MIEIEIEGDRRNEKEIIESWVNQQINKRREANLPVCVRIYIKENHLDIMLSSPECPRKGKSKTSHLTKQQEMILSLWEKCKLNTNGFHGGNLVTFYKQVDKYL
jgi:hypothetical protein